MKAAARAREVAVSAARAAAAAALQQHTETEPAPGHPGFAAPDTVSSRHLAQVADRRRADVETAAVMAEAVTRVADRVSDVAAAAAVAAAQAAALIGEQLARDIAEIAIAVATAHPVDAAHPTATERRVPLASELEADRRTALRMHNQGASASSTAAALNAAGSRAAQGQRWSSPSVLKCLAQFPDSALMPPDDLTGRLAHAESDLAEAQRLGGLGSWSWDVAADQVHWSDQMYRLFGVLPEAFDSTYDGFLLRVHPNDRQMVADTVATAFAGSADYEYDHRVIRPDGQVLWLHTRGVIVRDATGAPIRLQGTVIDTTAAMHAQQRDAQLSRDLTRLSSHDALTGLANRRLLHDRLGRALTGDAATVSVLVIDLDDFKSVNDRAGHAAGDSVLTEVAQRLRLCVRGADTVARIGGDEFAIVMPAGDPVRLAARILAALSAPVRVGHRSVVPSASIGIAHGDDATDADALVQRADTAMYAAKAAGKGRTEEFDATLAAAISNRASLLEDLAGAAGRGEIVVHYQPIIDVRAGSANGMEALVRWQHGNVLVPPMTFVPLAEESGLIVAIGHEVLRQACRDMRGWLDAAPDRTISINVSPLQLAESDYAGDALAVIHGAGVRPDQIILEVTETLFLNTTPSLIEQLDHLRSYGIRVSLDDFGTGYSSLGRLHTLPIDSIKIDKSFIDLIDTGREELPIITSMIVMAHALGLDVTAEGVETTQQATRLVALGCDHLQGYHFSRPQPAITAPARAAQADIAWTSLAADSVA